MNSSCQTTEPESNQASASDYHFKRNPGDKEDYREDTISKIQDGKPQKRERAGEKEQAHMWVKGDLIFLKKF